MVQLLLICCLCTNYCLGSSIFVFFLVCITLCPFKFGNYLEEEDRAGCFAFVVLLYIVALPYGAVSWPKVCDRDISRTYSFTFFYLVVGF